MAAQVHVGVPIDDPAYDQLRLLRSALEFPLTPFTTRPLSRAQIAEILLRAGRRLAKNGHAVSYTDTAVLTNLARRFQEDLGIVSRRDQPKWRLRLFDRIRADLIRLDGPARQFANPRIDAVLQPFTENTEDRKIVDGRTVAFESSHWLTSGGFLNVYYQGRLAFTNPRARSGQKNDIDYQTLRLYLELSFWNLNLLIGKESLEWGPGAAGQLSLSGNAGPLGSFGTLPLFQLTNQKAFRLPWIFRGLGPMRFVVFIAKLEEERRDFGSPYYIGKRLNFKVGKNTEIGFSHTYILGGKNFPESFTFWDGLAEFFFIRIKQNFIFNVDIGEIRPEDNIGNHFMGVDFQTAFPGLRFATFYGEIYTEDVHFNFDRSIHDNVGFRGGIYLPNLLAGGRLQLRLEGVHTPSLFYVSSAPFLSGQTFRKKIFGNNLGPAGNEAFLNVTRVFRRNLEVSLTNRLQRRGVGKHGNPDRIVNLSHEWRYELRGALKKWLTRHSRLTFTAAYQRVWNFDHRSGNDRNDFYTSVRFDFYR